MDGNHKGGRDTGNRSVWLVPAIILACSMAAAAIAYPFLPDVIPMQWNSNGGVIWSAGKPVVFLIALLPVVIFWSIRAKYGRR